MADSIISQFRREFNNPIETDRQVQNITDRDNINSSRRWQGMLVYVTSEDTTYYLGAALDNTAWEPISGLEEAPIDGQDYVRKNGAWGLLPLTGLNIVDRIDVESSTVGNGTNIQPISNMVVPANTLTAGVILEGRIYGTVQRVSGTPIFRLFLLDNQILQLNISGWGGVGTWFVDFVVQISLDGLQVTSSANCNVTQFQQNTNSNSIPLTNANQAKNVFLEWNASASETFVVRGGYIKKIN